MKIEEIYYVRHDERDFQAVSIKLPWYNDDNRLVGVFGISFPYGGSASLSIAQSLTLIAETGLLGIESQAQNLTNMMPGFTVDSVYLSKRETQCLYYLVRGKTNKGIANKLDISTRTVEHYVENIKYKMGVFSKSELIEKTIDSIVPNQKGWYK